MALVLDYCYERTLTIVTRLRREVIERSWLILMLDVWWWWCDALIGLWKISFDGFVEVVAAVCTCAVVLSSRRWKLWWECFSCRCTFSVRNKPVDQEVEGAVAWSVHYVIPVIWFLIRSGKFCVQHTPIICPYFVLFKGTRCQLTTQPRLPSSAQPTRRPPLVLV